MTTPRRMDHPYVRRPSPSRSSTGGDQALDEGEHQIELDEVTIATAPAPSRFHVFTNLARAVHTRVSYMWGSFHRIIVLARRPSPPLEPVTPTTPQDTIRGQLNKLWVPLSEHLPRDYDEVLMRDHLHCLETTIAHALTTRSKSLPNCILLLQEVETDIRTRIQLMSAQSDAAAWYTVLGTYTVLTSHINNLTSRPAHRGLFPEAANTSTPQPLPPPHPPASSPSPNASFSTPFPSPPLLPPSLTDSTLPTAHLQLTPPTTNSTAAPATPNIHTFAPLTFPPPPPPTSPPPPPSPHTTCNCDSQLMTTFAPHPAPQHPTAPTTP